jgi:hypothetical protein
MSYMIFHGKFVHLLLALELAVYFSVCSFYWVKRDANHMADAMAKVAHSLCLPFCCSKETLPPSVK